MEQVLLASPRGFCAGVDRAIEIVERALERFGPPVYVRHEIVHNRHVVDTLRAKGAVFIEDPADVPEGAPLVFSAHGVSPAVREAAGARALQVIDATCPLVTKVHKEAQRMAREELEIVMIGHRGHVEVDGTMGQAPDRTYLVESNRTSGISKSWLSHENRTVNGSFTMRLDSFPTPSTSPSLNFVGVVTALPFRIV